MSRVFAGFLLFISLAAIAGANSVSLFFAPGYGTTSGGEPIPSEGFTFEMGTFANGFQPTYENRASWHEYWITEDPASGVEVGLVQASSSWWSDAPFLYPEDDSFGAVGFDTWVRPNGGVSEGDQIYIWGYSSKDLSGIAEWILVSNPNWTFPAPTFWGELVLPNYYPSTTEVGTTAVVGSINHPDYPDDALARQLQTASVGAVQGSLAGGESQWESGTFSTTDSGTFATSSDSTSGGDDFGTMEAGSGEVFPYDSCTGLDPLPIPTPYDDWIAEYAGELGGETAYTDEPMHDGVPNITKYALGLDPTVGGRICLPRPVFKDHPTSGVRHLALQFTRPDWLEGVAHVLETSTDLAVFTQHHEPVMVTEDIIGSPYEKVWILDPEPSEPLSRRFLRLRTEVDSGIRVTARCEPDDGVLIEVDASAWLSENQTDLVDSITIERAFSPEGEFFPIASGWGGDEQAQYLDPSVDNGTTYFYRAYLDYTYQQTSHQTPLSNVAFVHVTCARESPSLTATCRSDRIMLEWLAPDWATEPGFFITDWTLMTATDKAGPYEPLDIGQLEWGAIDGAFADAGVAPETPYYYYITFTYTVNNGPEFTSPQSDVVSASTCDPPVKGPMDIAFIIDNTSSMGGSIQALRDGISTVIDDIEAASGGSPDYRLALVTPDDNIVNVRVAFSRNNRSEFLPVLNDPNFGESGINNPESTDECLNTVVNGLWTFHRDGPATECSGKIEQQEGDFFPPFDFDWDDVNEECISRSALKIVVLITDDAPGGFCDDFTPEIQANAEEYTEAARCQEIRIASILIGDKQQAEEVMKDYATITGGWYAELPSDGSGIEEKILDILYEDFPDLPPEPDCSNYSPYNPCEP